MRELISKLGWPFSLFDTIMLFIGLAIVVFTIGSLIHHWSFEREYKKWEKSDE